MAPVLPLLPRVFPFQFVLTFSMILCSCRVQRSG